MKVDEDIDFETEARLRGQDANRLAEALELVLRFMRDQDEGRDILHSIVVPNTQITLDDIARGALARRVPEVEL